MRKNCTNLIFIITFILALFNNLEAQFTADADGVLTISPLNGNMNYIYPISNNTVDGHQLTVTLNYVSNIVYTSFDRYLTENTSECTKCDGWNKFTKTHPGWLLSVNGFAVQVLGYKSRIFDYKTSKPINMFDTKGGSYIWDYEFADNQIGDDIGFMWSIEGYDFCNRMQKLESPYDQDIIKILKGDGSILELRNPNRLIDVNNNPYNENLYTGYYYSNTTNTNEYAIVEFDTITYFPDHYKNRYNWETKLNSQKPRVLKYYNGDGLEYVFHEIIAPYALRMLERIQYLINDTDLVYLPVEAAPTIFYLEKINSSMRKITDFKRKYHYPSNSDTNLARGRAPLLEFAGHKISYGDDNIALEVFGRSIILKIITNYYGRTGGTIFNPGDMTLQERMYDRNKSIRKNLLLEENTSYFNYYGQGEIGLVSEIIDPERRKTEFKYLWHFKRFTGFDYPYSNPKSEFARLDTIIEPTRAYFLQYYCKDSINKYYQNYKIDTVNKDDILNNTTLKLDTNLIDVVKKVQKYDFVNKQIGNLLTETEYVFNENNTDYYRICTVILHDTIAGLTNQTKYYFMRKTIEPYRENPMQDYYSPDLQFIAPIKIESINGNINKRIKIDYVRGDSITPVPFSKFFYFPVRKKSELLIDQTNFITTSYDTTQFDTMTVNTFGGNTDLSNAYGKGIGKSITSVFRADTNSSLLYTIENEYLNLNLLQNISVSKNDTIYDYLSSKFLTDSLRSFNKDTSVAVYTISSVTSVNVPPIWNLNKSTYIYDKDENILAGKINVYEENFNSSNPLRRRGALISDTVVGKGGMNKKMSGKYFYKNGWYQNFVNGIENIQGTRVDFFYNYFDDTSLNNNYPSGKRLYNNNDTDEVKLFNEYPQFESPVSKRIYIRKLNDRGEQYLDTIKYFQEKSHYGQTASIIDPNGWYYHNEYDSNGRATYIWEPFDFPPVSGSSNSNLIEDCIKLFDIKTSIIERTDTLFYSTGRINVASSCVTHMQFNRMSVGYSIGSSFPLGDTSMILDTLPQINTESYVTFKYYSSNNDAIHYAGSISQSFLRLFVSGYKQNECITLKLKSNKFNFEQMITIGCPKLSLLPNAQSAALEGKLPVLRFDLNPIIDSLRYLSAGDSVEFQISSISLGGVINFLNASDDLGPAICIVGTNSGRKHSDYTFHYEYDDSSRITKYFAKIDDAAHTSSSAWSASTTNLDGRYTSAIGLFRADNVMKQINNIMGNPWESNTMDSVVKRVSGLGYTLRIKDQDGNYFESLVDNCGRLDSIAYPDGNGKKMSYLINKPYNITEISDTSLYQQDFYGVCFAYFSKDELGKTNAAYYDGMGNLRRTITDIDSFKLRTYYDYDISGNLIKVINPNNQETKYWYDSYGNLIYKNQSDINYVSYSYDNSGKLRFSQSQEQADSNKLAFIEYDDLGRTTLIGEAKIDTTGLDVHEPQFLYGVIPVFNRLTDIISPDTLHVNLPNSSMLYANKSLYEISYVSIPYFDLNLDSTSCNISFPEDPEQNNILPAIRHNVNYFEPLDTIASFNEFENISKYPQFVRSAICYDKLPYKTGSVWMYIPVQEIWDSLAPNRKLTNLIGRQAAVAYRDHGGEAFHYLTFSYDARGRIEAVLRYTENLGFDAVYYKYNSMNQILSVKVADPLRQYMTWYSYDNNGRVDSVWTSLGSIGTGLGIDSVKHPADLIKPQNADVVYFYNKRGSIDTINFVPANVIQSLNYSKRGWLDSIIATRNYDVIFKQNIGRDASGNILSDTTNRLNQSTLIQNYEWDRLQRLTHWSSPNNSSLFGYDAIGNRISAISNFTISSYHYSQTKINQLLKTVSINPSDTTFYSYNTNGAVSLIVRTDTSAEIGREEFSYTMGGLLKKFVKYNYQPLEAPPGSAAECFASTRDSLRWDWRYRYSPLGGREQKRLYYSPLGDSCNSYHRWDYYLRGAFGEQLAVYTGKQIAFEQCDAQGRKVYMYPNSYLTNGGELVTKADGTREFSIADHLGSTRVIVDENGNLQNFDYKPFGEAEDTNTTSPRIGFIGSQQDGESNYFALGARMYDPKIGRFLSPDPLLEMFPEQTPYQYAFNSPLIWKDPSGLKGEKERGDKMMGMETLLLQIANFFVDVARNLVDNSNKKCKCFDTRPCPCSNDDEGGGGSSGSSGGKSKFQSPTEANLSASDLLTSGVPKGESSFGNLGRTGGGLSSLGGYQRQDHGSIMNKMKYFTSGEVSHRSNENISNSINQMLVIDALNYMKGTSVNFLVKAFISSIGTQYEPKIIVGTSKHGFDYNSNILYWSPQEGAITEEGNNLSPATILVHELAHWWFTTFTRVFGFELLDYSEDANNPYDNSEDEFIIKFVESTFAREKKEIKSQYSRKDHKKVKWFSTFSPTSNKQIRIRKGK